MFQIKSNWSSPLQAPDPTKKHSIHSNTARRLFFDADSSEEKNPTETIQETKSKPIEHTELTFDSLGVLYNFDFMTINLSTNAKEFFAVREQVFEIEKLLRSDNLKIDIEMIRTKITQLLSLNTYKQKMQELGLILFYLDRDGKLPEAESLILYRAEEMTAQVISYLDNHAIHCKNPLIPSGKTHYLVRAFAHMCFTSTQTYNRGGLIAVKQLLVKAETGIAKYLQPEHREHILTVIGQILSSPSFEMLFKKSVAVHPQLQDAIRLDLKLAPDEKVLPVHAFYDAMMALFSDIRQVRTPNCYAISSLIYATENHTYKVLSQLIEWLEQGHYVFNSKLSMPIRPLLEKRLVYCTDLEVELENQKTLSLVTFAHISQTLALQPQALEKKSETLGCTLSNMLNANNVSKHLPYAEKLYFAYKFNTLNHMQLAIFEFAYMNSHPTPTPAIPYSIDKSTFIERCLVSLEGKMRRTSSEFRTLLKAKLGEKLWFENCNETSVKHKGSELIIGNSQVVRFFKGDMCVLSKLFKESLRIFYLQDGKYTLLTTITDLQKVIEGAINETQKQICSNRKDYRAEANNWISSSKTKDFRIAVSNYASNQINKIGISGKDLNLADLFVFKQLGGQSSTTLNLVYNLSVEKKKITECRTPYRFLEKLLEELKTFEITHAPKIVIRTPGNHAWTLSSDCWKILIENKEKFYPFIEKTVFRPAKSRLSSKASSDVIDRIIEHYSKEVLEKSPDGQAIQSEMRKSLYQQKSMTYNQLKDLLLEKVSIKNIPVIKQIIDEEFSKVTLDKPELTRTLKHLNITLSTTVFNRIFSLMPKQASYPFALANALRMHLISEKVSIESPYEIEQAICKTKKLPLVIDVGDLNWVDMYREDPEHTHLTIAYNWAENTPSYYQRISNKQSIQFNDGYEAYEIQYPKSLVKVPDGW